MKQRAHIGAQGRYKLIVGRPGEPPRVETHWFDNLILDAGLNRMGTGACGTWCHVGTGSTAPANGQTQLADKIAATSTRPVGSSDAGTSGEEPYYWWGRRTFRFGVGEAEGNLTEVGIGWSDSLLFSRALIVDGEDVPTTLTVLADEVLDVVYELRVYAPADDIITAVTLDGEEYDVTIRASDVNTAVGIEDGLLGGSTSGVDFTNPGVWYNGAIGLVTAMPSGSSESNYTYTRQAYDNNSQRIVWEIVAGLDVANFASPNELRSYFFRTCIGTFQMEFTPRIPKDATKVLTLNVALEWDRYTP